MRGGLRSTSRCFFFSILSSVFSLGSSRFQKPYKLFFYVSDIFDFNLVKNKEPARCGSTSLKKNKVLILKLM